MRTPRARSLLLLAGIALAVTACGGSGASDTSSAGAASGGATHAASSRPAVPSGASGATSTGAAGQPRTIGAAVAPSAADIVEDGTLVVRVRNANALRSSYDAIGGLAAGDGGFVSSSTIDDSRTPTADVTVRVPNDQVRGLLRQIGAMGKVTTETLKGQDVTGQVIDMSVEITNLTSEEAAVRQLLAKVGTVATILTVQQQLFQLQDEVQQLTAQSDSLHNRVQYATIAVTLSTTATRTPVHHHHRAGTVDRFWHLATSHSVSLVRSVVLAVGWSAPGVVLLAVAGAIVLVVRRRRHTPSVHPAGPVPVGGDGDRG